MSKEERDRLWTLIEAFVLAAYRCGYGDGREGENQFYKGDPDLVAARRNVRNLMGFDDSDGREE